MGVSSNIELIKPILKKAKKFLLHSLPKNWRTFEIKSQRVCGMMLTMGFYRNSKGQYCPLHLDTYWSALILNACNNLTGYKRTLNSMTLRFHSNGQYEIKVQ